LQRSDSPWSWCIMQRAMLDRRQPWAQVQVANYLLSWACVAERLLRSPDAQATLAQENEEYLQQKLEYRDGKLLDANGEAVMMEWEKPLMLAHANLICQSGGHVLNVGFGLGLIDDAIQG
jgi:type IV protein arginine methyltransferase